MRDFGLINKTDLRERERETYLSGFWDMSLCRTFSDSLIPNFFFLFGSENLRVAARLVE